MAAIFSTNLDLPEKKRESVTFSPRYRPLPHSPGNCRLPAHNRLPGQPHQAVAGAKTRGIDWIGAALPRYSDHEIQLIYFRTMQYIILV